MKSLQKIQNLPERTRKIILWSLIVVLAAGLLTWWVQNAKKRLANFQSEGLIERLNLPDIEMPSLPDLPDLSQIEINETTTDQEEIQEN